MQLIYGQEHGGRNRFGKSLGLKAEAQPAFAEDVQCLLACVSVLPQRLAFGTPRKLPRAASLEGRVVVLDIAFAGAGPKAGFAQVTLPLIEGLGDRLRGWIDHHDHDDHEKYATDPRFILCTKAEHGACPEMITPEVVAAIGPVDTVLCHNDFDGLVSAAKWMRGGTEPYPGADDDARAVDTRVGKPGPLGERLDRALRARPRDDGLFGIVVRHLYQGLEDAGLWRVIDDAGAELIPIEKETRRAAQNYQKLDPGVALVDVRSGFGRIDKTLLLLLGQQRARSSIVVDKGSVTVAAPFDSGLDFVKLLGLSGGMPTRVSIGHKHLGELLTALGVSPHDQAPFLE